MNPLSKQGSKLTGDITKDHWKTPINVYKNIKEFLGNEFFDPCPVNPKFDGLATDWGKAVYVNPPFSKYYNFINKGLTEYYCGNSSEIVWLSNSNTETKYYQALVKESSAIFFFNRRLSFLDENNIPQNNNTRGQTLFFWSKNTDRLSDWVKLVSKLGGVTITTNQMSNIISVESEVNKNGN